MTIDPDTARVFRAERLAFRNDDSARIALFHRFGGPEDDSPHDEIMGGDVYDAWQRGDLDGIRSHLVADVEQVRAVFRRLVEGM